MEGEYMHGEGHGVDYRRLAASVLFTEYVAMTRQLVSVNIDDLDQASRTAFFLSKSLS